MSPNRRPPPGGVALPSMCVTLNSSGRMASTSQEIEAVEKTSASSVMGGGEGEALALEAGHAKEEITTKNLKHATLNRATLQRPRRRGAPPAEGGVKRSNSSSESGDGDATKET